MTKKDPSKRKLFKEGSLEEKLDKDSLKPSAKRLREVKQKIRMESAIRNSGVPLHERIPVFQGQISYFPPVRKGICSIL